MLGLRLGLFDNRMRAERSDSAFEFLSCLAFDYIVIGCSAVGCWCVPSWNLSRNDKDWIWSVRMCETFSVNIQRSHPIGTNYSALFKNTQTSHQVDAIVRTLSRTLQQSRLDDTYARIWSRSVHKLHLGDTSDMTLWRNSNKVLLVDIHARTIFGSQDLPDVCFGVQKYKNEAAVLAEKFKIGSGRQNTWNKTLSGTSESNASSLRKC